MDGQRGGTTTRASFGGGQQSEDVVSAVGGECIIGDAGDDTHRPRSKPPQRALTNLERADEVEQPSSFLWTSVKTRLWTAFCPDRLVAHGAKLPRHGTQDWGDTRGVFVRGRLPRQ